MATYEQLPSLIGKLKRYAIDSWMAQEGWTMPYGGSTYSKGGGDADVVETVTCPDENGEGGGDWDGVAFKDMFGMHDVHTYEHKFPEIRDRIDRALDYWLPTPLPDPTRIEPLVEAMRQANAALAFSAISTDGKVTGGGEIGGNINLIIEDCGQMGGGLITTFKQSFLAQLSKAIGGHHAITVIVGGALAAQQKMWEDVRQSVADLCTSTGDAFYASANGGGSDWHVLMKYAGYGLAGASIFATGGAATAIAVAGLGLDIADGALPAEAPEVKNPAGDNYDDIMAAFEKGFYTINDQVVEEENDIVSNLHTNMSQIRNDAGSYELDRPGMIDVDDDSDLHRNSHGQWEEIKIDEVLAREIADDLLPAISDELNKARYHMLDAYDLAPLWRHHGLGIGSYGPSDAYHEVHNALMRLVENLSGECRQGGIAFSLAIDDIGRADTDQKDALAKNADFTKNLEFRSPLSS